MIGPKILGVRVLYWSSTAVFLPRDFEEAGLGYSSVRGSLGPGFRTSDSRVADIMALGMDRRGHAELALIERVFCHTRDIYFRLITLDVCAGSHSGSNSDIRQPPLVACTSLLQSLSADRDTIRSHHMNGSCKSRSGHVYTIPGTAVAASVSCHALLMLYTRYMYLVKT